MKKDDEKLRPEIWAIAKARAARCARSNIWINGVEPDEIADAIAMNLYPRQTEVLSLLLDGKTDEAESIIRKAVRKAENAAVCETRKSIRALVPYQVRKAKESGKAVHRRNGVVVLGKADAVDEAYAALAQDMRLWSRQWCDDARVNQCVRFTLKNLPPIDREIGLCYMRTSSWQAVAKHLGLSEGDFRRKHLPRFKAAFAEVWKKVW